MIEAAKKAGVERFLHMSALGVGSKAKGEYFQTKWLAEEALRKSTLHFTIFRPSIIYGAGDKFTNMIADMIRKFRIFPLIDGGINRMQPVSVEEVAIGFATSLKWGTTIGRTYEVGGLKMLQFREVVSIIAQAVGVMPYMPTVSMKFMKPIVKTLEKSDWFPLTMNQLEMLLADNVTENRMFTDDLGITPIDFKTGVSRYLKKR
jgi:NADH dehydrogenase